jgi:hypothetical protein
MRAYIPAAKFAFLSIVLFRAASVWAQQAGPSPTPKEGD